MDFQKKILHFTKILFLQLVLCFKCGFQLAFAHIQYNFLSSLCVVLTFCEISRGKKKTRGFRILQPERTTAMYDYAAIPDYVNLHVSSERRSSTVNPPTHYFPGQLSADCSLRHTRGSCTAHDVTGGLHNNIGPKLKCIHFWSDYVQSCDVIYAIL